MASSVQRSDQASMIRVDRRRMIESIDVAARAESAARHDGDMHWLDAQLGAYISRRSSGQHLTVVPTTP